MGLLDVPGHQGLLKQTEMRETPRNRLLGLLAEALMSGRDFADRAKVPDAVPLIGGQGLGSLVVGKGPEELNEWSYGNAPMRINPNAGRTASYMPEMKRGRGQGLADALMMAQLPGGKGLLAMGAGAMDGGAVNKAATVWHGSPHKFDKFDSSKIGTGEGAQAYGHGLYLAESPDVAGAYQKALSSGKVTPPTPANEAERAVLEVAQYRAQQLGGDVAQGLQHMARNTADPQRLGVIQDLMNRTGKDGGALYKVDLPDEKIARMLDYDSAVSEAQRAPLSKAAMRDFGSGVSGTSGERLYKEVVFEFKNAGHPNPTQAATDWLRNNGVPGIRYLDGGSRSAGTGSSNYVVFPGEENALTILERNGQRLR